MRSARRAHNAIRTLVEERDDNICVYCGDYAGDLDHILPYSAGGKATPENLVCCCHKCNMAASNWIFDSFEDRRRYILLRRFSDPATARSFREMVGAGRLRC